MRYNLIKSLQNKRSNLIITFCKCYDISQTIKKITYKYMIDRQAFIEPLDIECK